MVKKPKRKKKVIGEILKKEGVIREPEPEETEKPAVEMKEVAGLLMRINKIEGRLDMFKETGEATQERIGRLAEEIGDLRRMILDREGSYSKLEADFEKVQTAVKEIEPVKIAKDFERFAGQLELNAAKMERVNTNLADLSKRLKTIENKFLMIKDFENLVGVIKKIGEKMGEIKEDKRYVDRLAGKIESIFSEMTDRLAELKQERETILKVDNLTREMVKSLDKFKIRFDEEAIKKKELDEIKKSIAKEVKGISPEAFEELKRKVESFDLQRKSVDELEEEKDKIERLLERVEKDYKTGELSKESYEELKKANEEKLERVNSVLEFLSKKMLYEKVKRQDKRIAELESIVETLPKGLERGDIFQRLGKLEKGWKEIEELRRKTEDLSIAFDRIDGLESSFEKLERSLKETTKLSEKVEEIKLRRKEFEVEMSKERERLETNRNLIEKLTGRLNELFEHIISLEGEVEKLEKSRKIPFDARKIRESLIELSELVETKADKKELEEFETRIEGLMERHAQLIKKLIERMKWVR
ncbi:MAG: hypothetical protein QMD36_05950 [Candidatus Aenigmarchaeota archaeon]|nr:hypothetical protein [Candidatus Aenigmarchaeota archaeon]